MFAHEGGWQTHMVWGEGGDCVVVSSSPPPSEIKRSLKPMRSNPAIGLHPTQCRPSTVSVSMTDIRADQSLKATTDHPFLVHCRNSIIGLGWWLKLTSERSNNSCYCRTSLKLDACVLDWSMSHQPNSHHSCAFFLTYFIPSPAL